MARGIRTFLALAAAAVAPAVLAPATAGSQPASLAQDPALLAEYAPVLRYDSAEHFFADSAAEATDNPAAQLHAGGVSGPVIATVAGTPHLSLSFLAAGVYPDGHRARATDTLTGIPGGYPEAVRQAARLHAEPGFANVVYGREVLGADGVVWLQYWMYFLFNHSPLGSGIGDHWGDWKVIELRLGTDQVPDLAVYEQHRDGQSRAWNRVPKSDGSHPVVYVALGSHALEFRPGWSFSAAYWPDCGAVPDYTNGRLAVTPSLTLLDTQAWSRWPGVWGESESASGRSLQASSPRGPIGHTYFNHPAALVPTCHPHDPFNG